MPTKELIAKSLLQLAKTKPLKKITVAEIANNCLVRRETFYYHFIDKYELMFRIYKYHTGEIIEKGISSATVLPPMIPTCLLMSPSLPTVAPPI